MVPSPSNPTTHLPRSNRTIPGARSWRRAARPRSAGRRRRASGARPPARGGARTSSGSWSPSAVTSSPLTLVTVRRSRRTGVESTRCAAEIAAHPAATRIASTRIVPVCAKYAVSAGNAPHARANQTSEWNAPPNSSRLYATTRNPPTPMNAHSHGEITTVPWIPNPIAPPRPTTAIVHSTPSGMRVRSGRPLSSSSAWAARPIARKNATSVSTNHPRSTTGARQAPMTTYDRCHAVYGGCSSDQ